jgi:hypothetical protein
MGRADDRGQLVLARPPCVDGSVAFTWTMRGCVLDDRLGLHHRDAVCEFEDVSYVVGENGRVREEIEFFDRAAAASSIGLAPTIIYSDMPP